MIRLFRVFVPTSVVALVLSACGAVHAQSFPSRPITIVVPYGPGGPADILARIMAERMRGPLGATYIEIADDV